MSATLNQDDIKLLKSVFATKDDLVAMEKRQDAKYATKDDLKQFATRVELKQMIENSENSIIQAVTDVVGISVAN